MPESRGDHLRFDESAPDSARPALAPLITVDEPLDPDGSWIIAHRGVPRARVSAAVAAVARSFTGAETVVQIADRLGDPWSASDVSGIAERLAAAGMLRGAKAGRRIRGPRWLQYRPPLTLQVSFGDPRRLFAALRPVTRLALGASGLAAAILLVVAGLVATILGWADIVGVLQRPVSLPLVGVLAGAVVLTTLAHELGHGAVLSAFGGSPRRMGAMLFYLAPAFFCDVTDGWRLSRRGQRVAVALAGPAVHLLCASLSIVAAGFAQDAQVHAALVLYAISCLAIALLNLLPFVQLDGYLALMAALDRPHLRRHAMDEAASAFGVVLLGIRRGERESSDAARRAWLVAYGVGCRLFPVLLVGVVLHRYATSVAGLAAWTALSYLATVAVVLAVAAVGAVRGVRRLAARRPDGLRVAMTAVGSAAVLGAVLWLLPIAPVQHVGFVNEGGPVRLVATRAADLPPTGAMVSLETRGVLTSRALGTATVASQPGVREHVALEASAPISGSGLRAPAWTAALEVPPGLDLPDFGRAGFPDAQSRTVAGWLWQTFIKRPLEGLGTESGR